MSNQPSSPIRFACPQCGGKVKVPSGQAGQRCRCPKCNAEIVAPGGAPPAGAAPSATAGPPSPRSPAPAAPTRSTAARSAPAPSAAVRSPAVLPEAPPPPAPAPADGPAAPVAWPSIEPFPAPAPEPIPDPVATPAPPVPFRASYDEEFGVDCLVCGTRLHVRPELLGQQVPCPDCHTPVLVKRPQKHATFKTTDYGESDLFKLSEEVDRPTLEYPAAATLREQTEHAAGAGEPADAARPPLTGNLLRDTARQLLSKAAADQEAEERAERETSPERFTRGLLTFLVDWRAGAAIGVLSLPIYLTLAVTGEPAWWRWLIALPAACGGAAVAAVLGAVIVMETTTGRDKMTHWHRPDPSLWAREAASVFLAGFLAVLPGFLLGQFVFCVFPWSIRLSVTLTVVGLGPPLLLSMLTSESPFKIGSPDVWGHLREEFGTWQMFYSMSLGLAAVGHAAYAVACVAGLAYGLLPAAVVAATLLVYFRLVGRLAWVLMGSPG